MRRWWGTETPTEELKTDISYQEQEQEHLKEQELEQEHQMEQEQEEQEELKEYTPRSVDPDLCTKKNSSQKADKGAETEGSPGNSPKAARCGEQTAVVGPVTGERITIAPTSSTAQWRSSSRAPSHPRTALRREGHSLQHMQHVAMEQVKSRGHFNISAREFLWIRKYQAISRGPNSHLTSHICSPGLLFIICNLILVNSV